MSDPEPEFYDTRLTRFLLAIFGKERLVKMTNWLVPPDRCPWIDMFGHQCEWSAGHRGSCCTHTIYGDEKTWYGINYDEDTGAYIWKPEARQR